MNPSTTFLRNNWYVAAWSHEVDAVPFGRRILGQSVAMCRLNGQLTAVEDRCVHRGMPLSMGRIVDGTLQCAYHGLRFGADGQCVLVPGQDRIPPNSCLRTYPVIERDGLIWIWMGDPMRADHDKVPGFPQHNDPEWHWRGETFHYRADHLFLYDNLLDLTHVGYVHRQTIGGQEESHSTAEVDVKQQGDSIVVTRWMRNVEAPPTYKAVVPFTGLVNRWQRTTFQPGVILISAGADQIDGERLSYASNSFQAITPETEGTTHYFWSTGVDARHRSDGLLDEKYAQVVHTFEEDRVVIEAQYERRMEDPSRALVSIRSDGPSVMARRIFARLIAEEQALEASPSTV